MYRPYLFLVFAMMLFAGNLIVGKPVSAQIPPITLTLFRYIIALLVVLPFGYKEWKENKSLWKKEWKAIVSLSISGLILFNVLVYLSLNYTTSINAAIVESSTPVFALVLGFILLKETFTKLQLFGVVFSFIGVIIVITRGSIDMILSLSFNPGDLTMLVAMLTWSIYSILIKKHAWKFPTYGGLLVMSVIAVVILAPFAAIEVNQLSSIEWSPSVGAGLLYLGIFPSLVALVAYNKGINAIGPAKASIFLNLIPIFTMIGAMLFLGEKLTWLQAGGSILVITGVMITNRKQRVATRLKKLKSA
ncbi:DMT family transporter [Aquibacillus albus]|uniref:Drug/metabolite transporter (DMT)-like permease n=1 Tax=Aquibacillus albus TaxID=1168171 RepID=A0ABS2N2T5_9BACI|nr:DMT family transporter [Aquibacillus albus]MBM7572399.1 drug/metabolite transporter (DMT)-like permease [Aquibacillus albus]